MYLYCRGIGQSEFVYVILECVSRDDEKSLTFCPSQPSACVGNPKCVRVPCVNLLCLCLVKVKLMFGIHGEYRTEKRVQF